MEAESTIECNLTKKENNCQSEGPTLLPVATTSNLGQPVKLTIYNLNGESYLLVQ